MELQKLLEVIQVQRHDFLNHLQVISGCLQLNKADRVQEYIRQVIADMRVMSQTARLEIPEVALALLVGINEAAKYQMEVALTVDSKMDECAVPGTVAGLALEYVWSCFLENLSPPGMDKRSLALRLAESREKYTVCLGSRASNICDFLLLKERLAPVREHLHKHGGESNVNLTGENLEILLEFPRKRAENGQTKGTDKLSGG